MTLSEIRKRLQALENPQIPVAQLGDDPAVFPHWLLPNNNTVRIRFLPDGNADNCFFWVERYMIKLSFNGIKGQASSRPLVVNVPCMKTWNEPCPITDELKSWWNHEDLKQLVIKYTRRKSYLLHGFVRDSPFKDQYSPEQRIWRISVGSQVFNKIRNGLVNPDLAETPTDYKNGMDFEIRKTQSGDYADYQESNWVWRTSGLTLKEKHFLKDLELSNLVDSLPEKPTELDLKAIMEMFEASIDGEPYDLKRWGEFYKPINL